MKQYDYKGRIYSVTNCELKDIPSHIERVYQYWDIANVNLDEQTKLLEEAVKNNTAYKVIDDKDITKSVIYCNKIKRHEVQSNLLWLRDKRMFSILCYYLRLRANIHTIYFKPHTKTFIPFEFVVNDLSIRLFHSHDYPLKIDLYSKKSEDIYKNYFLRFNIKEL